MIVRRFALPLAVCAIALLGSQASAQSVFAPADDAGSPPSQNQPFNPFGGEAPSPAPTAPQGGAGIFAPAPTPNTAAPSPQFVQPQGQAQQLTRPSQRPVPAGERNEFAYRTLGIEVPDNIDTPADPLAAFTPEQIEIARKGFAAMEADNPQMISRNPFRQIDAMAAAEKAQAAMVARAKAACGTEDFNIMVSPQSFTRNPSSAEGLTKNGVPLMGNLLQQLCSDQTLRSKLTTSVPMITIVNRANAPANVVMTDGIITFSADFASDEPPAAGPIRAAFVKAIEDTDKFMNTRSEPSASR